MSMKKLIIWLGMIWAIAASCSKDSPVAPQNTPIIPSSKYTIITQKNNSKIYGTFMMWFNDPGNWWLGLKDTTKINRFLSTWYYSTWLKDYYLWDVWLNQYMDNDAKLKISWWKEISEADLSRYFDLINWKIDIWSFKKDIIAKDMVKFIETEYILAKIKNNEQFIWNNYVCLLSVPRKYFAGWPSGFMLDFTYTDSWWDTKQWMIIIVSVWTEYYKENENRKLWNIKNIANTWFTHEPFHFHVSESLKTLWKQNKDLWVSVDKLNNILDKDGNMIIDKNWHALDYYNLDLPWYIELNIVDKYGNKVWNINSNFGPAWGFANIYPWKWQTILVNKWSFDINPTELIKIWENTSYKISALDGIDNNPYDPDSPLWQAIKKNISKFIEWQNNFVKKIPNTNQWGRLAYWENNFATNIQSSIVHIDE